MTTLIQNELIADASITTAKFDPAAICPNATNATNATNVTGTGTVGTTQIALASVTPAKLAQPLTQGTAVATTAGLFVDFIGIPSWAKRITVLFNGISTSGTSAFLVQVGTTTPQTTGYVSGSTSVSTSTANSTGGNNSTAGFTMNSNNAASAFSGIMSIINVTGNIWAESHSINTTAGQIATVSGSGLVTLSAAPDRVRLTTVSGTDTFDAGSFNVFYE